MRYERRYPNSMWHTDWKQIRGRMHDGEWLLRYQDDVSRFVTGYGVFDSATAENALAVLEKAMRNHGKPECQFRTPEECLYYKSMEWSAYYCNEARSRQPLDFDKYETPPKAFCKKRPQKR